VTGGSSGLGAAVAAALLDAGAGVVSLDRRPTESVFTIETDLADSRAAERSTVEAAERLGGLDAIVTCAGVDNPGPFGATVGETWDRIVAVNLLGTAAVVRAGLPYLEESSGRIVTVASTLGHRAVGDASAYCASKFGVVGFTRALAAEFRGRVGVTLLTPGGMQTAFFDDRDEQYKPPPDARLASPGDVAAAVVWALQQPDGVEVKELAIMAPGEGSWP
jgi:NAD(P)-dependent dehydrogenase (short-subunit alcohol dehydrogenase family)